MKVYTKSGDPRKLALLEVNARRMSPGTFHRLVENIRRDGVLTQYPFIWLSPDGERWVLSGNHRVRAAIEAGLGKITWIETDEELTEQQRTAIQLSHNSIAGEDDLDVLKELYAGLTDEEWAEYAALDDEVLAKMADEDVVLPEDSDPVPERVETFVKLADIFGTRAIPAEAAEIVRSAVNRMLNRGEITDKAEWRALEFMAAEWLAKP